MKIKIMGRYKITELLLVIYFIGIHNSSGEDVGYMKKLYKAESKLFNRLLTYYEKVINRNPEEGSSSYDPSILNDNGDINRYPDEIMFDLVQVWYTLFWVSVNLKIRSLVHKMKHIENPSRTEEIEIAKDFDSLFIITSEIFENLKSDIANYYRSMQNRKTCWSTDDSSDNDEYWSGEKKNYYRNVQNKDICGTTRTSSSDIDVNSSSEEEDIAKSVWGELLELNLDFLMSTETLENRKYSSYKEYTDGLIEWRRIKYRTNGHNTLLPNNSPCDTNYFVIDYDDRNKEHDVIKTKWCSKMIRSIINRKIHNKIMDCFTMRLTGSSMFRIPRNFFMIIDTPNVDELEHYLNKFSEDQQDFVHKIIVAVQMVRIFTEQILISNIEDSKKMENLLTQMKKNLNKRKMFFGGKKKISF